MTPDITDGDVGQLLRLMEVSLSSVYLDVIPEPYAKVVECFPAVVEKIRRDGGSQQLGWQIWKTSLLVEAEFHAVWKSPNGELRDITPKQLPIARILFLPDTRAGYIGAQVDNVRLNITGNRLVDDFIEISKAIFRIQNKGVRAFEYEIRLTDQEAQLHHALLQMHSAIYAMAMQGLTRNDPCFCGSGKKYKRCHGEGLADSLGRI